MESKDLSQEGLALIILEILKNFEEENKDKDDNKDVGKICRWLIFFLWKASKNEIPIVTLDPPEDDERVLSWAQQRREMCFKVNQVENTPLPSRPVQAEKQVLQNEVLKNLPSILLSWEEKEASMKGFTKLHVAVQNMILNASAPNSKIKASSCSEECALFFKSSNSSNSHLHFLKSMKYAYNTNCDVA